MNKDVSVQYAYKKDGKGERHGDEAERMLASQAKKHNILPEAQQMPAQLLLNGAVPAAPAAMLDFPPQPTMGIPGPPPSLPPGFGRPVAPQDLQRRPTTATAAQRPLTSSSLRITATTASESGWLWRTAGFPSPGFCAAAGVPAAGDGDAAWVWRADAAGWTDATSWLWGDGTSWFSAAAAGTAGIW